MAKDYKDAPSPRGESRLSHPMLMGVIIGLLLGVVISLAVALWLNRLNNPFMDKARPVEPVSKMTPAQPAPPPEAARAAEQAAKGKAAPEKGKLAAPEKGKPGERPRFEFYSILPGDKEATPEKGAGTQAAPPPKPAAAPVASAPTASAKPGSSPASPKPHSGDVYWLQAGAFTEEREADNLKARIALTGLEAAVRPVATPDKGTLFRVRLGPYQSLEDANRNKATLTQNGVGTAIIRTTEEARKP
jgi:cell division protein FtsN